MVLESRITWEKLCLELELISKEEPKSLIPLLIGINSILRMDDSHDWCSRTINFMLYELATLCEGKCEKDRLAILNEFFFETRDFQIRNLSRKNLSPSELILKSILEERAGASIPVMILYLHLAHQLDLPIFAVDQSCLHVLRWVRGSKTCYIDLAKKGEALDDEELLQILNKDTKLEPLSFKKLLIYYLNDLYECFELEQSPNLAHAVLSMLLKIEPTNLKYLADRALLRKRMGHIKEAMQDLKRYFSFTDIKYAPLEMQIAARELQALAMATSEFVH